MKYSFTVNIKLYLHHFIVNVIPSFVTIMKKCVFKLYCATDIAIEG